MKIRLYESLVISTLLYGAESWPLSVTQMKKLEAVHHKFQRRLLGITWRDKDRNEDIRKKTGSRKLEDIIKERMLRWLGHVLRMDNSRTAHQATDWELRGYKRKPGRPRKNWVDVIKRDLRDRWTWPGKKPRSWRMTKQNGVDVWPNAAIWMRDELRSKVR